MSFDITFHPFGIEEVERYVFAVWRDSSLAEMRARELSEDATKRRAIVETLYRNFPAWRIQAAEGKLGVNETLAFACAALSGYRHFYFYARGSALSFAAEYLPEIASLFTPFSRLSGAPPELIALDDKTLIDGNYRASGFLPPEHFGQLRRALDHLAAKRDEMSPALFSLFDAGDREALEQALEAAEKRGLGLIEAADLVIPAQREGSTDLDKLRLIRRHQLGESKGRDNFPCLAKGGCGSES